MANQPKYARGEINPIQTDRVYPDAIYQMLRYINGITLKRSDLEDLMTAVTSETAQVPNSLVKRAEALLKAGRKAR